MGLLRTCDTKQRNLRSCKCSENGLCLLRKEKRC